MKNLFIILAFMLFYVLPSNSQNMENEDPGYILTEIWNAKPSWFALSKEERQAFFNEKINPLLMGEIKSGAEILGCAVNNNDGSERMDYQFMAIWKFPNKESSDKLEKAAKDAGFLKYFDQVNFSGNMIPPPVLNEKMVEL